MINYNGGPVFPTFTVIGDQSLSEGGITIRDYFAAHASSDDIAHYLYDLEEMVYYAETVKKANHCAIHPWPCRSRAEAKFMYADAMLKARNIK